MICKCEEAACPRLATADSYCYYCVRMFPCDHVDMDRAGRIVGAIPRAHADDCDCTTCNQIAKYFDPDNADIEAARRKLYGNG